MKENDIQGYKATVGRSQRDPEKVVRIEIAHGGNTTLLAARLEYCHGGSPVVSGQLLQWPMHLDSCTVLASTLISVCADVSASFCSLSTCLSCVDWGIYGDRFAL